MKANLMTDGQMQNFSYLESEIVETASLSDRDSPDYFDYNDHIDHAVDVFMDRLGGRLGELEQELRYAWNAVDLLSQEYVRMWGKLERLEILLYEQQNVIAQLLSVMQTNGALRQNTQHLEQSDQYLHQFNNELENELSNQYDYDMELSPTQVQEAMILAEDPSEAFARQTFQEWLSQHSSSLHRQSEMLDKLELYDASKDSDTHTRPETLQSSQYESTSSPPTSRPSSASSSRWLTRRQTLKRWQEIDDSSESFDKASKSMREDDNDMALPENKEQESVNEVSEVFSVTDYLDYRAQNKSTPSAEDSEMSEEVNRQEKNDRCDTSEQWLRDKLEACNVALIHDNESLNDKPSLSEGMKRETTPSTQSIVDSDYTRAQIVTDLMSEQRAKDEKDYDHNEPNERPTERPTELSQSSIATPTSLNHFHHYRQPVSDLSQQNQIPSSRTLSDQIPEECHFVADLTDNRNGFHVSESNESNESNASDRSEDKLVKGGRYEPSYDEYEYELSHSDQSESVFTLDQVEMEISNAIKLINDIEENSISYSNSCEKHNSKQSNEQINNEREDESLRESEPQTKIETQTQTDSIGTEQTIDYSSDVSHTKALMMPITDQNDFALTAQTEGTATIATIDIIDSNDSSYRNVTNDQTSQPTIGVHQNDVSDKNEDVIRESEPSEHSLIAIQRTLSGKRKLATMPSLSSSGNVIPETSAQYESKQYNRIEKQSTNVRHERNTLSSSVPVHPIPDIDNTNINVNGSANHRRGSSFDDNKGLLSSFATSVYQGYQSVISMPSLPSLFKRESQEKIDDNIISGGPDHKRRSGSAISGMFSGFGWKSSPAGAVTQRSQSVQQTDQCAKRRTSVHQLSLPELSSGEQDQTVISLERPEPHRHAVSESECKRQPPYVEKQQSVPLIGHQLSIAPQQRRLNGTESSNASTAVDKSNAYSPPSVPSVACVALQSEKRLQNVQQMNQNLLLPNQADHKGRPVARQDSLSVNTNAQLEKSVSEESAFFSCVSASSRQSSILQSEFGSMESSDSVALSLGQRDTERKSARMRSDDDSAFCSTNGDNRSALADETDQQSVLSSTSPQPVTNTMANQFIQNIKTRSESPSVQSPTVPLEKRDSVGSTSSTGFQNRFASIMRQKLEQRSQQPNSFSQSVDISTADSSIDSDLLIDDQRGIPKKGRTKWMAAVVRSVLLFALNVWQITVYFIQ